MNNDFIPKKPGHKFNKPNQNAVPMEPRDRAGGAIDLSLNDLPSQPKQPKKAKSKKKWLLLIPLFLILLVVGGLFYANGWYQKQLEPRTAEDIYHVVEVSEGDSVQDIAKDLQEQTVIKNARAFEWYVKLNKVDSLQAGAYRISSKLPVSEIVGILAEGRVTTVDVLIPPGRRLDQIIEVLEDAGYSKNEIETGLKAIRDHQLLANLSEKTPLEGYIFPDTYKIGVSTTVEELLRLALDNFRGKLTTEIEAGLAKQDLTIEQAINLASIVQMESSNPETQRTIAQVFLKRLRENVPLGADPTFRYGSHLLGVPDNVNVKSPYNTRIHSGLPPTAIANFNLSALQAVANPTDTNYLYFVAGDDGVTRFSNTLAEHEALTKQYCVELCQL